MTDQQNSAPPSVPAPADQATPPAEPQQQQQQQTAPPQQQATGDDPFAKRTADLLQKLGHEAAYKVLRSHMDSGGKQPAAAPTDLSIAPATADQQPPGSVADVLTRVGVTAEQLAKEWGENQGKLSDATYQRFRDKGYPPDVVNMHMQAQATQAQAVRQQAIQVAGGEEQFANLRQWAAANIPPAELETWNNTVKANPAMFPEMIRSLKARHTEAVGAGKAQPLIAGDAAAQTGGAAKFRTLQEQNAAFNDKRFAQYLRGGVPNPDFDPAFRAQTIARKAF